MTRRLYIVSLLVVSLVFYGCGSKQTAETDQADQTQTAQAQAPVQTIQWKMQTHWPASSSSYTGSAEVIVKKLNERTGGRLQIELHPAGALVPAKELFNAVKRGMIQIVATSSAYPRDQVPLMNIASGLPMNFRNVWECVYFNKWLGFDDMVQKAFAEHGLYYSADKVYPTELSLKKPVKSMADFKGLKLRSSGVLQTYLSALGAAASYLPGSEVYAALSSGVVDGAHWGAVQGSDSMGFYEVNKYHLRPALNIAQTDIWLINQKALDELPKALQDIVKATLDEHFWLRTNQYQYLEEITLNKVQKEKGVQLLTLPDEEVKKMKEVALATWDEVAQKSPDCAKAVEMLKQFNESMGR